MCERTWALQGARRAMLRDGYPLGHGSALSAIKKTACLQNERLASMRLALFGIRCPSNGKKASRHLEAFVQEHGHCRVPQTHVTARWISIGHMGRHISARKRQHACRTKGTPRCAGLRLGSLSAQWEEGFGHLEAFVKEHGHCRVPQRVCDWQTDIDWGNGSATSARTRQAVRRTKGTSRRARLRLGSTGAQWEEGFQHLEIFMQEHGHCGVPKVCNRRWISIGVWVSIRREREENMSAERKARSMRLGSSGIACDNGKRASRHLQAFVKEHGHCRVPQSIRLQMDIGWGRGSTLASKQDRMPAERKARLDTLALFGDPYGGSMGGRLPASSSVCARTWALQDASIGHVRQRISIRAVGRQAQRSYRDRPSHVSRPQGAPR